MWCSPENKWFSLAVEAGFASPYGCNTPAKGNIKKKTGTV
jgi:hypothetical protein